MIGTIASGVPPFNSLERMFSVCLVLLLASACSSDDQPTEPDPPPEDESLQVSVQWEQTRQTIHGFGASDAWSTQFVGKHWPAEKKNQIADWLFSRETGPEGQPQGIGLSIWRFNIGAGSAAQGENSGIEDPWRRSEGFLQEDMTYDWSQQQGQRWFLEAAKERGVSTFIGFVNSPPVELTRNDKAYGSGWENANLASDQYDDFAQYLATVGEHFESEGLGLDYISPVNEPQWNWSQENGQEGSPYLNSEIEKLTEALNQEIERRGLTTQIEIPEAAQINYLYASDTNRPQRDDQIAYFFGEGGVQDLSAVAHKVAGHSYYTTWPVSEMISQRRALAEQMQATDPSLEYWMSEYCILADNEEISGGGLDRGMDPALYVARVMHFDLTVANASSWQWWLGVSPYDYKDGLVYIDKNKQNGEALDSKLLWGLGNYSRFLQPGAVRLGTDRSDNVEAEQAARSLMVSAYRGAGEAQAVVVAVNYSQREREMRLSVEGLPDGTSIDTWQPYVTSSEDDLAPASSLIEEGAMATVPARSIVTFVGDL